MFCLHICLAIFLSVFCTKSNAIDIKTMAKGVKNFGKQATNAYELGRKTTEGIGQQVVKEGFDFYCSHGGKGANKFVKFIKCDDKHAKEKYCEYANNGPMMFELLCETMKEKGVEWFGKAMGCWKTQNQDCFVVWFEEMQSSAEMVKAGAEQIKGK